MRLIGSAPVTWPSRAATDRWWAGRVAEVAEAEVGPDGVLREPGAGTEPVRVRLAAGDHLAPGAQYDLEDARSGAALPVAARVEGEPGGRTVRVALHERQDRGGAGVAEVVVDGLDGFTSVTGTSTHRYARGELSATGDPAAPLDLHVRLRWLDVRLHAAVGSGSTLDVELVAHARGLWSPVTAPLLAVLGRSLAASFPESVEAVAGSLTAVAEGRDPEPGRPETRRAQAPVPESPAPEAEALDRVRRQRAEDARWSRGQLRHLLESTQSGLEGEGRSGRRAWLKAYDAQPPVRWPVPAPGPDGHGPDWAARAREAAEQVAASPGAQRRQAIETALDGFASVDPPLDSPAAPRSDAPSPAIPEDAFDLRWLRSPWSTMRYLTSAARSAGGPATDPAGWGASHPAGDESRGPGR